MAVKMERENLFSVSRCRMPFVL